MLATLCVVIALIGVLLIVLGAIPATRAHIPGGINTGIALFLIAVVAYAILAVAGLA